MDIQDQYGVAVNTEGMEKPEQDLANKYIEENDVVLELGARYGSVSCIINSKLKCKTSQVVVEPDDRVWDALERNKQVNNCEFHILKGFISQKKLGLTNLDDFHGGYGSTYIITDETTIPSYTLDEVMKKYNVSFNVLVADCEGFLEIFFDENPTFYDMLRLIIFEADYLEKCNYNKIRHTLKEKGFIELLGGYQNVWIKNVIKMDIQDQYGVAVNTEGMEKPEQDLANKYIEENDVVLELGARYGSVSCIINSKLKCKTSQVVVEPDDRVWDALERNKQVNNCEFHILKGFISQKKLGLTNLDDFHGGYGSTYIITDETTIPSYTLDEVMKKYNVSFNVLVADCEGFLEIFFDENPTFYDMLRLIIFEADYLEKCNYNKIRYRLKEKGFTQLLGGYQNVWIKNAI